MAMMILLLLKSGSLQNSAGMFRNYRSFEFSEFQELVEISKFQESSDLEESKQKCAKLAE